MVRLGEHRLQIMPTNGRRSYVRARVEVQERMDGSLAVYYQGDCLATKPAPAEAPVLRARNTARATLKMAAPEDLTVPAVAAKKPSQPKLYHHAKPGPNHPWRRPFRVHIDGPRR